MKKLLFIFVLALSATTSFAQQLSTHNIYTQNRFLYSPANTGDAGYPMFVLNVRNQWTGIEGAPKTRFIGFHSPMGKKMSMGGKVISDQRGVFSRMSATLDYSYQVDFTETQHLTMGLSGGFENNEVDRTKIHAQDYVDITSVSFNNFDGIIFGASTGLRYNLKNFEIDFAAPELFQHNYSLRKHFIVMSSYDFYFDDKKWNIEPSFLYRTVPYSPTQIDYNLYANWNKFIWGQFTYRSQTSMIFSAGLRYFNVDLGYAFELNTNQLGSISNGSYEIFVGYHLDIDRDKDKKKVNYSKVNINDMILNDGSVK